MYKFIVIVSCMLITACATPLPPEAQTPHLSYSDLKEDLTICVLEQRDFILNGDKEPWFEGIFHGAYGIPMSLKRPGDDEGKAFSAYLSGKIKAAIEETGVTTSVIELPMGTDDADAVRLMARENRPALLVIMRKSRYDVGFTADYNYDFRFIITNRDGQIIAEKIFAKWEDEMPLSEKYNLFDMFTEIYSQRLGDMLNDPLIRIALQRAGNMT